jgi:hypothetical protein
MLSVGSSKVNCCQSFIVVELLISLYSPYTFYKNAGRDFIKRECLSLMSDSLNSAVIAAWESVQENLSQCLVGDGFTHALQHVLELSCFRNVVLS